MNAYIESRKKEVKNKLIEYSDDFARLVTYLKEKDNDEAVNQFKYYILTYLKSNEENRKLFATFKKVKLWLILSNIAVLILFFSSPIHNSIFSKETTQWLLNTKEMLQAIPFTYYGWFYASYIIIAFTSFLFILFNWCRICVYGIESDNYKKKLCFFTADYQSVKNFLKKVIYNRIINIIAFDLVIVSIPLINAFGGTLITYKYGLNLFIITTSVIALSFLLALIVFFTSKKLHNYVDEIYDSIYE